MIRLEGVTVEHRAPGRPPVRAVDGLDLEVARGETLCLIGPSGCGKTTTLRLMNRLERPTRGRVVVDGRDTSEVDVIALRRSMGYVLQAGALFPHLTVGANVGLLCELEGWDPGRTRARVAELLELVHLDPAEFAGRLPEELSGGQQQRVAVARALALDPPVLLMDEPFGALDPITRDGLQREFLDLSERLGKTIVLVSHDLREASLLADRVALLRAGRLLQVGPPEELRRSPADGYVARFVAGSGDA